MTDPLFWHRLQFGFTITYHYLFPQLTMGLALLIVVMKAVALRTGKSSWNDAARFWIRIFGLNFAMGVVTGVPMEFQFGTNWAAFSRRPATSSARPWRWRGSSPSFSSRAFWRSWSGASLPLDRARAALPLAALALFVGSWLSGYFIIATNAFLQHPQGHELRRRRRLPPVARPRRVRRPPLGDRAVLSQPDGSGRHRLLRRRRSGSLWRLRSEHREVAAISLRVGVIARPRRLRNWWPSPPATTRVASSPPTSRLAVEGRFESGGRAAGDDRPAQRRRPAARQSDPSAVAPVLDRLRRLLRQRPGPERLPRARLAGQRRAALLRLSHHGRPRHPVHRRDGDGDPAALARPPRAFAIHALGPRPGLPLSLHHNPPAG